MSENMDLKNQIESAKSGDKDAIINLFKYYLSKDDKKRDEVEATYWLKKWEETGDVKAKYTLGLMYCTGKYCVVKNFVYGINLIRMAAKEGCTDATDYINNFEENVRKSGFEDIDDYLFKVHRFIQIDDCDDKSVSTALQENLGDLTLDGDEIVEKIRANNMLSLSEKEKIAKSGNIEMMQYLVYYYEGNVNGRKNINKAIYWNKKLAENGDTDALFRLGLYYLNNEDMPQNLQLALEYLQKAAQGGNENAEELIPRVEETIKMHKKCWLFVGNYTGR